MAHQHGHRHGHRDRERESNSRRRRRKRRTIRPGFSHEKALIFGVIQLLAGVASLILGIVAIATRAWGYFYGSGFWAGLFFMTAGMLGIVACRRKSNCAVVSFMVFSAIAAMLALVLMALAAIGIASDHMLFIDHRMHQGSAIVVHSLVIVVAVIGAVAATASSIIGCRAVCGAWYSDSAYETTSQHTASELGVRESHRTSVQGQPGVDPRSYHRSSVPGPVPAVQLDGQQMPFPLTAPGQPMGPHHSQQIAFLSPVPPLGPNSGGPGGMYMPQGAYVMQASNVPSGFSQVMYVMPAAAPTPQPGGVGLNDSELRPPGTPPPSYSQLDVRGPRDDEDEQLPTAETTRSENGDEISEEEGAVGGAVGGAYPLNERPAPPAPQYLPTQDSDDEDHPVQRQQQIHRLTPMSQVL